MKNQMVIFEGKEVEVLELEGVVYFNPYHIAKCLEISETSVRKLLSRMNENQVVKLKNSDVTKSHIRKLNNAGENFLTESGVYKLVFRSNKPNAEKFTDWVTDEVLPSIRETGKYSVEENSKPKIMRFEGQPVVTLKEIERVTGNNTHTVLYWLKNLKSDFKEREEYFLLEGKDLQAFKDENKEPMSFVSSLIVIGVQGIVKLSKILPNLDKLKLEFEKLIERVKKSTNDKLKERQEHLEQSLTTFNYLVESAKNAKYGKDKYSIQIRESLKTVLMRTYVDISETLEEIYEI